MKLNPQKEDDDDEGQDELESQPALEGVMQVLDEEVVLLQESNGINAQESLVKLVQESSTELVHVQESLVELVLQESLVGLVHVQESYVEVVQGS